MAFTDFTDGLLDYGRRFTFLGWGHGTYQNIRNSGSYSDFVSNANESTDGWYGTAANAIPYVRDLHNAVLDRDRTLDILHNTGRSWSDIIGYNSNGLTSGAGASLGSLTTKIEDGVNDLFEFYTGDKHKSDMHNKAQLRAVKASLRRR